MTWKMTYVRDSFSDEPAIEMTFENFEDGIDWLRQNDPGIFAWAERSWKSLDGEGFRQLGTDNYWASFKRVP